MMSEVLRNAFLWIQMGQPHTLHCVKIWEFPSRFAFENVGKQAKLDLITLKALAVNKEFVLNNTVTV